MNVNNHVQKQIHIVHRHIVKRNWVVFYRYGTISVLSIDLEKKRYFTCLKFVYSKQVFGFVMFHLASSYIYVGKSYAYNLLIRNGASLQT